MTERIEVTEKSELISQQICQFGREVSEMTDVHGAIFLCSGDVLVKIGFGTPPGPQTDIELAKMVLRMAELHVNKLERETRNSLAYVM